MTTISTRIRRGAAGTTAAAFALAGLVALGTAAPAGAAFDPACNPASPVLKTLKIKPGKVNVKKKKRVVTISGTTTGPALSYVSIFGEPAKGPSRFGYQGKPKARSFSVKVAIPKGAALGKHNLTVSLSGKNDSYNYYDTTKLSGAGLPTAFNVTSKPDYKAPKIKKISIKTKKVNTTKKAAKVTVTAKLNDKGGSGLNYAWVEVGNDQRTAYTTLRKKKGKWTGTLTFPKWAGKKKATVVAATVYDNAGNATSYGTGQGDAKLTKALKAGFNVKSKTDTKKPSVASASATPKSVKVGDRRWQISYSVNAKDSQSGVASVAAKLVQVGGSYPYTAATSYLNKKKGKFVGKGVVECYLPAGTYAVELEVTDNVGRKTTVRKGSVTFN